MEKLLSTVSKRLLQPVVERAVTAVTVLLVGMNVPQATVDQLIAAGGVVAAIAIDALIASFLRKTEG